MRNLKRISALICSIFLCFTLLVPSLFAATTEHVYDYAGLLDTSEIKALEGTITELNALYKQGIYIVTTNDTGGKTTTAYADDFFFNLGYGRNNASGVLLLIDMDNRQVWISTSGKAISYFTDARIQKVIDAFYSDLKEGDYYSVGKIFLRKVEAVFANPIPTGNEVYSLPRNILKTEDYIFRGTISALIALVVSVITYFSIRSAYKNPRFTKPIANPDRSTLNFTDKKDQFIHTHTSRVRIKDDSNNGSGGGFGGGSSTHTSSGGGNFGGGGRGF